ncbi:MAG: hypothetical protein ACTSR1_05545 [Candidatus Heimdallarchaeota archaeon]
MNDSAKKPKELFAEKKIALDKIFNIDCLVFMKKIPDNSSSLQFE